MPETRPRRAAARRKAVIESSDEDEDKTKNGSEAEESEAHYTPSPPPPPKRARRSAPSTAPKPTTPTKNTRRRNRTSGDYQEAETTPNRAPKSKRIRKNATKDNTETELPPPPPKLVLEEPKTPEPQQDKEDDEGELADIEMEHLPPKSPVKDLILGQASPARKAAAAAKHRPIPLDRRISLLDEDLPDVPPRSRIGTPLRGTPKRDLGPRTPVLDLTQKVNVISTPPASAQPPPKFSQSNPPMSQPQIAIRQRKFEMPSQAIEEEGPKQRTVIVKLVLVNFKSYAGRQEVGPFHPSFTSVVGPNGSGKSNVIDSLLFVFGFRASKMRQGKVSALIHNSGAFPDVQSCEVEVHFQEIIDLPNGEYEVVPDSTLIITRKAFKNNSSIYTINGKNSTFTEVTTLLRARGVDLDHKRFLILQGEVESIAQMKPKAQNDNDDGLLEYLEDIIGTAKYKQPIEESAQEAETLNEVCVEKSNRVQIVEKEKDSLEDKKNVALAFIQDENELAHKQSTLYQLYMHECTNNNNLTAETIAQIELQLNEELEKHKGNEDGIKKLQKQYNMEVKDLEGREKEAALVLKELARYDKDSVKLQEKEKFLKGKQKKLQKSLDSNNHSVAEAETQIEKSTADVDRLTGEINELEARLKSEEAEYAKVRDELKDKTQVYSDKITVKQKSLDPFNTKINEKKSQMAVTQSELDILNDKGNASKNALEEIRAKIKAIKQTGKTKEAEFEACQEEIAAVQNTIAKIGRALEKLAAKEPVIKETLSGARTKAEEAKASFSQSQNQGSVLTGLMRLKESGRVEGFHGRLGHLGTIDQKYDVAISTACPQLENMVVDTVEVGQHCIEYLRKNNLGRAMFICLDRLPQRNNGPINTPEDVPRLYDLVKPKEARFAPAFYSVLRDTLVAKDMAQANRIAYGAKRWRVVTLDGQLIDKSGTMTGGGTRIQKGAMSSKVVQQTSKETVQKLEMERETQESNWQEFLKQRQELEKALKENNDRLPMLETQMAKINLEIESAAHNLTDAQKRAQDLMQEMSKEVTDDGQASALQAKIKKFQDEIDEIVYQKSSIEEEIKALQEKIMQVGGIRLRTQKTKVDDLKEQLEQLNTEINAAEISRSKAEKNLAKSKKALATCEKDLNNVSAEIEGLDDEKKDHELAAQSSRDAAKEVETYLEKKKDEIAALKEELDAATAELNKTRAIEIEIRNRLEENQKVLAENQKRFNYWREKAKKLTLHSLKNLNVAPPARKIKKKKAKKQRAPSEDRDGDEDMASGSGSEGSDSGEESEEVEDEDDFPVTQPGQDGQDVDMVQVKNEDGEDDEPGFNEYTPDELDEMDKDELKTDIALLEEKVQNVNVDLSVLAEYSRRVAEHAARAADLDAAVKHRDTVKTRCDELRKRRLEEFMDGFSQISLRLKEMYQMITMGGNAELELVDSLDPFSEGILFSVMPPKKSWKNISNLSGGEKTLSSLALVFALHHYKPTPLYVMDEIDAALDFRNVSIVASYIKERTKNAQFVVISLRNNMFELARRLVGVYKVNHMTKSIAIENQDYIARPAPAGKPLPPASNQQTIQASQAQIKG